MKVSGYQIQDCARLGDRRIVRGSCRREGHIFRLNPNSCRRSPSGTSMRMCIDQSLISETLAQERAWPTSHPQAAVSLIIIHRLNGPPLYVDIRGGARAVPKKYGGIYIMPPSYRIYRLLETPLHPRLRDLDHRVHCSKAQGKYLIPPIGYVLCRELSSLIRRAFGFPGDRHWSRPRDFAWVIGPITSN